MLGITRNVISTLSKMQAFFRADEFSWKEGTLINILSKRHQTEVLQGKYLEFFLQDAFKTAFQMRHLTHRWTQSLYFFRNIRVFFFVAPQVNKLIDHFITYMDGSF